MCTTRRRCTSSSASTLTRKNSRPWKSTMPALRRPASPSITSIRTLSGSLKTATHTTPRALSTPAERQRPRRGGRGGHGMRSTLRNVSSWPILLKKSKIVPAHHLLDQKSGELNNVKQYPIRWAKALYPTSAAPHALTQRSLHRVEATVLRCRELPLPCSLRESRPPRSAHSVAAEDRPSCSYLWSRTTTSICVSAFPGFLPRCPITPCPARGPPR
jgi:hypothetical protein